MIFSDSTITNILLILTVKKVWKLANIRRSYKAYKNVPILGPPCIQRADCDRQICGKFGRGWRLFEIR